MPVTHLFMPYAHASFVASKESLKPLLTRRAHGLPDSTRMRCCMPNGKSSHAVCCSLMASSMTRRFQRVAATRDICA